MANSRKKKGKRLAKHPGLDSPGSDLKAQSVDPAAQFVEGEAVRIPSEDEEARYISLNSANDGMSRAVSDRSSQQLEMEIAAREKILSMRESEFNARSAAFEEAEKALELKLEQLEASLQQQAGASGDIVETGDPARTLAEAAELNNELSAANESLRAELAAARAEMDQVVAKQLEYRESSLEEKGRLQDALNRLNEQLEALPKQGDGNSPECAKALEETLQAKDDLQVRLKSADAEIAAKQTTIQEFAQQLKDLTAHLENAETEMQKLKVRAEDAEKTVRALEARTAAAEDSSEVLSTTLKTCLSQSEENLQKNEHLKRQLAETATSLTAAASAEAQKLSEAESALRLTGSTIMAAIELLRSCSPAGDPFGSEVLTLSEDPSAPELATTLQAMVEQTRSRIKSLEADYAVQKTAAADAAARIAELEDAKTTAAGERAELEQQVSLLEECRDDLRVKLQSAEASQAAQVEDLRAQLEQSEKQAAELLLRDKELADQVAAAAETSSGERARYLEEIGELERRVAKLDLELVSSRDACATALEEARAASAASTGFETRCKAAEDRLAEVEEELSGTRKKLAVAQHTIAEQQERQEESVRIAQKHEEGYKRCLDQLAATEQETKKLLESLDELSVVGANKISKLREEHAQALEECQKSHTEKTQLLTKQIAELREQNSVSGQRAEDADRRAQQVQIQAETLRGQIDATEKSWAEKVEAIQAAHDSKQEELRRQLAENESLLGSYSLQLAAKEEAMEEIGRTLRIEVKEKCESQHKKALDVLQKRLNGSNRAIIELETELSQKNLVIHDLNAQIANLSESRESSAPQPQAAAGRGYFGFF